MKNNSLLFLFLLSSFLVQAQIGIKANHLLAPDVEGWTTNASESSIALPGSGWEAGIDYRLKLKNIRIESYPSLTLGIQKDQFQLSGSSYDAQMTGAHFFVSNRIYPLDLEGDCDCPTWRKEGPTLEKGLFIHITPGVSYFSFNLDNGEKELSANDMTWFIGGGLGFDIGINDLLTITPQGGIRYYSSINWETVDQVEEINLPESLNAETNVLQYWAGIRLGFHLRN